MNVNVLDLFSGIGGFSLGLERAGMETVAFCEYEEYQTSVLKKHWPDVPVYKDVRELTYERLKEDGIADISVLCGGYPCQPFSVAGKQRGQEDDRHLWPEMYRLIKTVRPRWVIAENVAGHITLGLDDVLSDLEAEGYTTWVFVIPAVAVNAIHRRDRLWIVSYAEHDGPLTAAQRRSLNKASNHYSQREDEAVEPARASKSRNNEGLADAVREGLQRHGGEHELREDSCEGKARRGGENVPNASGARSEARIPGPTLGSEGLSGKFDHSNDEGEWSKGWQGMEGWPTEPSLCGGDDGVPCGLDRNPRLKCLGNAVVPQIPELIGRAIMEIENAEA